MDCPEKAIDDDDKLADICDILKGSVATDGPGTRLLLLVGKLPLLPLFPTWGLELLLSLRPRDGSDFTAVKAILPRDENASGAASGAVGKDS